LTLEELEHGQLILSWWYMLSWMVKKYVQFVNNFVLCRMLYRGWSDISVIYGQDTISVF